MGKGGSIAGPPFVCRQCEVQCTSQANLYDHYRGEKHYKASQVPANFTCHTCRVDCTSQFNLDQHFRGKSHRSIAAQQKRPSQNNTRAATSYNFGSGLITKQPSSFVPSYPIVPSVVRPRSENNFIYPTEVPDKFRSFQLDAGQPRFDLRKESPSDSGYSSQSSTLSKFFCVNCKTAFQGNREYVSHFKQCRPPTNKSSLNPFYNLSNGCKYCHLSHISTFDSSIHSWLFHKVPISAEMFHCEICNVDFDNSSECGRHFFSESHIYTEFKEMDFKDFRDEIQNSILNLQVMDQSVLTAGHRRCFACITDIKDQELQRHLRSPDHLINLKRFLEGGGMCQTCSCRFSGSRLAHVKEREHARKEAQLFTMRFVKDSPLEEDAFSAVSESLSALTLSDEHKNQGAVGMAGADELFPKFGQLIQEREKEGNFGVPRDDASGYNLDPFDSISNVGGKDDFPSLATDMERLHIGKRDSVPDNPANAYSPLPQSPAAAPSVTGLSAPATPVNPYSGGASPVAQPRQQPNFVRRISRGNATIFICDLCQKEMAGETPLRSHLSSDKHRKKEMAASIPLASPGIPREEPDLASLPGTSPVPSFDSSPDGPIRCQICNIELTGRAPYEQHIQGSKHKKKAAASQLTRSDLGMTFPQMGPSPQPSFTTPLPHTPQHHSQPYFNSQTPQYTSIPPSPRQILSAERASLEPTPTPAGDAASPRVLSREQSFNSSSGYASGSGNAHIAVCLSCQIQVPEVRLNQHLLSPEHRSNIPQGPTRGMYPLRCHKCAADFTEEATFNSHLASKQHINLIQGQSGILCISCNVQISTQDAYCDHLTHPAHSTIVRDILNSGSRGQSPAQRISRDFSFGDVSGEIAKAGPPGIEPDVVDRTSRSSSPLSSVGSLGSVTSSRIEFKCDVCNIKVTGDSNFRDHLCGENHRKTVDRLGARPDRGGIVKCSCCDKTLPDAVAYDTHIKNEFDVRAPLPTPVEPSSHHDMDYCSICSLELTSREHAKSHYGGKNHQKRALNAPQASAASTAAQHPVVKCDRKIPGLSNSNDLQNYYDKEKIVTDYPRLYQHELYMKIMADEESYLCYLPTGTGKTMIACLVMSKLLQLNAGTGRQQIFFITDKNLLTLQQVEYIRKQFAAQRSSAFKVAAICGDYMDREGGLDVRKHHVLVVTAAYLDNLLKNQGMSWDSACCVVFDEVHHCDDKHPYRKLVERYHAKSSAVPPKLLGLTASPASKDSFRKTLAALVQRLSFFGKAKLVTASHKSKEQYISRAQVQPKPQRMSTLSAGFTSDAIVLFQNYIMENHNLVTSFPRKLKELIMEFKNNSVYEGWQYSVCTEMQQLLEMKVSSLTAEMLGVIRSLYLILDVVFIAKIVGLYEAFVKFSNIEIHDIANKPHSNRVHSQIVEKWRRVAQESLNESSPFQVLLEELRLTFSNAATRGQLFLLVLVRMRCTAYALTEMLKTDPTVIGLNLNVEHVVGHGQSSNTLKGMSVKKQKQKLDEIKNVQVFVATSVAEEGIDIPECHKVILLDLPKDTTSFVQLRGRARATESILVPILPEADIRRLESIIGNERFMTEAINKLDNNCING